MVTVCFPAGNNMRLAFRLCLSEVQNVGALVQHFQLGFLFLPVISIENASTAHPTLNKMDERMTAKRRPRRSMGYPEHRQPSIIGRAAILAATKKKVKMNNFCGY